MGTQLPGILVTNWHLIYPLIAGGRGILPPGTLSILQAPVHLHPLLGPFCTPPFPQPVASAPAGIRYGLCLSAWLLPFRA